MADGPRVIGVSGFMRTGKDSVAALLQKFGYERMSFADPLRQMASNIDPYILIDEPETPDDVAEQADFAGLGDLARYSEIIDTLGYETAKSIPDFRRFLQRLGTEGVRGTFGDDAWVNLLITQVESSADSKKFVIPDVRFPNEADIIHKLGGEVWRTERPGYEGGPHPSEANVLKIIPDVTLRADSLLDWEEYGEYISLHVGLGTLVLQQIGEVPEDHKRLLETWADDILNA